jgi:dTDP-4-dehydrorhamnose 3,5-epimerase
MIDSVIVSPLKIIEVPGGDVLHIMKKNENGYMGFGEAYFSTIVPGQIKAWKRHRQMTLNLVVPVGMIRFVIYDDREGSPCAGQFQEITLSRNNHSRLTVPPMVWMGFQCMGSETAMLLNIASIPHEPKEADKIEIEEIIFDWSLGI